jgi:hypothetical protein
MSPLACLCFGEEINHTPLPGTELHFLSHATYSLVSIQNSLTWLLHLLVILHHTWYLKIIIQFNNFSGPE